MAVQVFTAICRTDWRLGGDHLVAAASHGQVTVAAQLATHWSEPYPLLPEIAAGIAA